MPAFKRLGSLWLALILISVGCASTSPSNSSSAASGSGAASSAPQSNAGPKRITAVIQGDPHTLAQILNPASHVRGIASLEQIVNAGLTTPSNEGKTVAQLAEAVPSVENGLWVVLPDGRMTTTWKIREGAAWHDGTPFTADDLVFTWQVVHDPALPIFGDGTYSHIESVEAKDPRTVTVNWKDPFIEADTMFSYVRAMPQPRHLLEKAYQEDKASYTDLPYWSTDFVGLGPFKVKEWVRGSYMIFEANDRYAMGRPKLDTIEVRFILDDSTVMANLLSGTVDVTLDRSLAGDDAIQVADQWRDGHIEWGFGNWIAFFPQLLTPNPALVGDARFRKALMNGADRQQLVDVFMRGATTVADSYMSPNQPDYKQIEDSQVVRYPYDSRRATEILEGIGLTKGPDGFYRDASGQRLNFEMRTTAEDDIREKVILSIRDDWQKLGLSTDVTFIPRQRSTDVEYRATYPFVELVQQPNDIRGLRTLPSRYTSVPENSFRGTGNRSRYFNAEYDAMIDKFFTTVPKAERLQALGWILHHISDQVIIMPMFYNTAPTLVANRLVNVGASREGATQAWNSHLWDIKS